MCHRLISVTLIITIFLESEATKSLFIAQDESSSSLIKISCTVSDDKGTIGSINLHCPMLDAEMCYKNCGPICKYENDKCLIPPELQSITHCEKKVEDKDYVRFQYTIDVNSIKKTNGEWYCTYEDITSRPIKLDVLEGKTVNSPNKVTKLSEVTPKVKIKGKSVNRPVDNVVTTIPKISIDEPKNPTISTTFRGHSKEENKIDFIKFLTTYEVVIGIIIMLCISVLLNFIFCIRDSLIKQFIDNIKSNVPSSKYLLCCICQNELDGISATAKLDRVLSKDPDYISTDASYSSKNENVYNELNRPLITPQLSTIDPTHNYHSNITRSPSLNTPEIPPHMLSVNYDQMYMTSPRRMQSLLYNPYVMCRSPIVNNENYTEYANQRHSYVFQPNNNLQSLTNAFQNIPSKKHASQNDIDLIRHCDSQDKTSKPTDTANV